MNDSTSTKIQFLKDRGAHLCNHSGVTLLEHLEGTRDILRKEGAPEYLQDAGLFHSVYGTAYYMPDEGISTSREDVKKIIGIDIFFLILVKSSSPSILGILISTIARSGGFLTNPLKALSPSI